MVAHMNDEALRKTIATGEAWYYSRSRNVLWRKGETSGQTQRVVEMRRTATRMRCGSASSRSVPPVTPAGNPASTARLKGEGGKVTLPLSMPTGCSIRPPSIANRFLPLAVASDHPVSNSLIMRAAVRAPPASTGLGAFRLETASVIASAGVCGVEVAKSISIPAP